MFSQASLGALSIRSRARRTTVPDVPESSCPKHRTVSSTSAVGASRPFPVRRRSRSNASQIQTSDVAAVDPAAGKSNGHFQHEGTGVIASVLAPVQHHSSSNISDDDDDCDQDCKSVSFKRQINASSIKDATCPCLVNGQSDILLPQGIALLEQSLPSNRRGYNWMLLYSTARCVTC